MLFKKLTVFVLMLLLRSFMFPALSFESFAHFPLIEIRHLRHFIFTS
jgi:hypothetical protein